MSGRFGALVGGMARIRAEEASRRQRAEWYVLEVIGWAQWAVETRERRYPLSRAYRRAHRALGVHEWRPGDSTLRYVLTEPWDAAYSYSGRFVCRVLRRHNVTCRGRMDHLPGVTR